MQPKYPHVAVRMTGRDDNIMTLMGLVMIAMHQAGVPNDERLAYWNAAKSADYQNVLRVTRETVKVT